VGQILARRGHDLAWWRVVDASGHPPKDAQETAAQHYEHEGIPFHRAGDRVIVNLSQCRWPIQ
jgi:alkylated DNA nucleotide flippase Atl1